MSERSYSIAAVYGYAVCLVATVACLLSLTSIVSSVMDARNPLKQRRYGPSFASFENYKVDILADKDAIAYVPDDDAIQAMFEAAAKEEQRAIVRYRARRSIVTSLMVMGISIALFGVHFRWARHRC